jgi:hypothetical protein
MDESIKTPYDLIEITLDSEAITARPVSWNEEIVDNEGHIADGSVAIPAEFETSCPYCGDMILFGAGFKQIKCPHCARGEDIKLESENPFQDPGQYEKVEEPGPPDGAVGGLEVPDPDAGVAEAISLDIGDGWLDTDPAEEYHELVNVAHATIKDNHESDDKE